MVFDKPHISMTYIYVMHEYLAALFIIIFCNGALLELSPTDSSMNNLVYYVRIH